MVSITVVSKHLLSKLKIEITIAGCLLQWEKCLVPVVGTPGPCSPCWIHALGSGPSLSFSLPCYMHVISITTVTLIGRSYCIPTGKLVF